MNIPLTGLADLFSESYKCYKISNCIKDGNIIIEKGEAELSHAKAKAKIGALQWVILGLVAGYKQESINVDITSALGIGF